MCATRAPCVQHVCHVFNTCAVCETRAPYVQHVCLVCNTSAMCATRAPCVKHVRHVCNTCAMCATRAPCVQHVRNTCAMCAARAPCVQHVRHVCSTSSRNVIYQLHQILLSKTQILNCSKWIRQNKCHYLINTDICNPRILSHYSLHSSNVKSYHYFLVFFDIYADH